MGCTVWSWPCILYGPIPVMETSSLMLVRRSIKRTFWSQRRAAKDVAFGSLRILGISSLMSICFVKFTCPRLADKGPSLLHINVLVQDRRNSSALAMELRLSCTNPSISYYLWPSAAAWHLRFRSTQVQIITCLMEPSHYLNQWWLIVSWALMNKLNLQFEWKYNHFHWGKCIWKCLHAFLSLKQWKQLVHTLKDWFV